jgi:sulfite reductase alpha subunit-like flavoprotein
MSKIGILWGSETGTAQGLAETAEIKLKGLGYQADAVDMSDVKLDSLSNYGTILVLTSTWGDGDPPSNAYDLLGELQAKTADLSAVSFSVCALGDTAYQEFCKCGKDFDEALEKQGAKRIHPIQECDLDYDAPFEQWLEGVIKALSSQQASV